MARRIGLGALTVALALATPVAARAQTIGEILAAINGGSQDFELAAVDGSLRYTSPVVPTAGLKFSGFLRIDAPTEGNWTLVLRDARQSAESDPIIQRTVRAGQPMGFVYRTGPTAQLEVEARWSEGETTTARVHVEWSTCAIC